MKAELVNVDESHEILAQVAYRINRGDSRNQNYSVVQVVLSACNTQALIIWKEKS